LANIVKLSINPAGKFVLALTAVGELYSWGDGEFGNTGHGIRENIDRPRLVQSLYGSEVIRISAGQKHAAAVTANGELYCWGNGAGGRLGHCHDTTDRRRFYRMYALLYHKFALRTNPAGIFKPTIKKASKLPAGTKVSYFGSRNRKKYKISELRF